MWNIQGECEVCLRAIKYAIDLRYNKITIYYDYQGIEPWVKKVGNKREWKAKNDYTKGYVKKFDELSEKIKIEFVKVKGHSKDKWNDEADRLAKASLGK
ncbi:RNase H family protein [Clostridium sardiniense]|uniref:RNase H family protein n=1 Tax=Clostridium sardiniense TaxID=29369 RepID=UPI00195EBDC1|nr:RNase H family protein [Clostridium sardiniense]MBM7836334.1 ribonuclease HI [Clostridium sardiniense]